MMIRPMNNVNFQARLNVDISDEYLDKLQDGPTADVSSAKLLKGLKFLKQTAPMIGTDEDILTLSDKVPEDRPYFSGKSTLLLSLNDKHYKRIDNGNYGSSIKEKLKELFADLIDINSSQSVHSRNADDIVRQIKKFNTEA